MVPTCCRRGCASGQGNSESEYQTALARYNGLGQDAQRYGGELIGLYRVFEKYNGLMRNR